MKQRRLQNTAVLALRATHSEEERERIEVQLRQSQKMEAVGQLAGGIAHDFNNLLQAIYGYSELAQGEISPDEKAHGLLSEVIKASKRARTLVQQLLLFSRREPMRPKYLLLNDLIANLMKMLHRVIGEQIELTIVQGQNLKPIFADPSQIEQVIINLCVNARDAMPDGGRITIETKNAQFDAAFCQNNAWASEGEYVCIRVSDTGAGIAEDIRERIFEPFFTTKEVGKGTGLGLASVYGIVKKHDGLIHLVSEPNRGATFQVFLPTTEDSSEDLQFEEKGKAIPSGHGEVILFAEDEDGVRKLIEHVLTQGGYQVIVARDGEEAIQIFLNQPNQIDLALLDLIMPKRGGVAVSEVIRERRPDCPVLFSSGYGFDLLSDEFQSQSDIQIIRKPYEQSILLEKIYHLLHSRQES